MRRTAVTSARCSAFVVVRVALELVTVETEIGIGVVAVGVEVQARAGTAVEHAATLLGQTVEPSQLGEHRLDAVEVFVAGVTHGAQIRGCSTQRPNTDASVSTISPRVA